jgi:hypothetical protein
MGDLLAVTDDVREGVGEEVGKCVRVGIGVVVGATKPMELQLKSISSNAKKITIPFRGILMFIMS